MATTDEPLELASFNSLAEMRRGQQPREKAREQDEEEEEESCRAFGFLRGVREQALALELRFANRNCAWYSYNCLVSWRYNPSVGLLLKFTGDMVSLVLIHGSNLDALVNGAVDLPHGIQRHRIMWIREMDKAEARQIGQTGPTIDKIEIGEFDSQEELQEWLKKAAPVFARPSW